MEQNANTNAATQDLGTIRIYNCGGAGIGIGKYFEPERHEKNPGYAMLSPVYMDTSRASTFGVPAEYFYQLPEAEGSGGKRSFNGEDIIRYTGDMLQKFPPEQYNVVIHSTTGGSGSVMGPSIASELLAQGKVVIVFAIGGDDTKQYIKNSIGTMSSYEGIVETRDKPIILEYLQNGIDGTIEEVDAKVHLAISCLTVLFSGQNRNLDARDIYHWAHFDQVTSFAPQVGVLSIQQRGLEIKDGNLISVATLNTDLNNTKVGHPVEYQRVGVPTHAIESKAALGFPLHFAIVDGFLDTVMKKLRKQLADFEQRESARVVRNKLSDGSGRRAGNGVTFDD